VRLTARVDYALRAVCELAAASGETLTVDQLARAQGIPASYLETILGSLRRSGLVRGRRGPEGGFVLARPAAAISLADVIRALEGPLVHVRGERPDTVAYTGAATGLQDVWVALRAVERAVLEQVTLADVAAGRLPAKVRKLAGDPANWS